MKLRSVALIPSQCDGCGQTDDHPKLHYLDETYHHDCTPFRVLSDLHEVIRERVDKIIEATGAGTRGDALRTFITTELEN